MTAKEYLATKGITKPSQLLQLMLDSVNEFRQVDGFRYSMFTFGSYNPETRLCYGCLATTTALKLENVSPEYLVDHIEYYTRRTKFGTWLSDVEGAIDYVRSGFVSEVYYLFELPVTEKFDELWNIVNGKCIYDAELWGKIEAKIKRVIQQMQSNGH